MSYPLVTLLILRFVLGRILKAPFTVSLISFCHQVFAPEVSINTCTSWYRSNNPGPTILEYQESRWWKGRWSWWGEEEREVKEERSEGKEGRETTGCREATEWPEGEIFTKKMSLVCSSLSLSAGPFVLAKESFIETRIEFEFPLESSAYQSNNAANLACEISSPFFPKVPLKWTNFFKSNVPQSGHWRLKLSLVKLCYLER